jgi:hypothetical protein
MRPERAARSATDYEFALAGWLARHGPLGGSSALVVALGVCADVTALDPHALGRCIGSLATAHIERHDDRRWRWQPVSAESRDLRPTDTEIISRVGAVLFECLTGVPLADYLPQPAAVRARLRDHRPDLPQTIVDVTARLASARSVTPSTLDEAAAEIRRALGVADTRRRPWRRTGRPAVAAVAALLLSGAVAATSYSNTEAEVLSHGLTRDEMVLSDVVTEAADYWTNVGEFIDAFNHLDAVERLWRTRVPADDPRLERVRLRQGWARMARGDFLTAEQYFSGIIGPLERSLGEAHPYTSATRRALAALLERRGAASDVREQRDRATAALRAFSSRGADAWDLAGGPPAPGLLAHVAPHLPEHEWFRRRADGSYFSPVTSIARSLAGTQGWQLRLAATGACDAAVDVGRDPHRVAVSVRRAGQGWHVRVAGVHPAIEFDVAGAPAPVRVLLDATPDGEVRVWTDSDEPQRAVVDPAAKASPPYVMSFVAPQSDDGCAQVWWEVKPGT